MTTRYSEDWTARKWNYPTDVEGFLRALGTSVDDAREARSRVSVFLALPYASKMPAELRCALTVAGLLPPGRRAGYP